MAKKMHRNSLQPDYKLHWYRIERILGQGGFGITYLAYDYNLDRRVAIKEYLPMELAVREGDFSVYPASEAQDERYRWGLERFIAEARTLARFKHPNIVRVLSVFEENNTAYMVMEYEHGESMQELLSRREVLEEQEIIKIVFPIMGGLELVHETGFVHRDIKPANIFLREDGSPVLLDFGSARQALGEKTKSLTSIVSPGYAPFEQYYSKSDRQGPWTDIYGLGATMYRALSGRAPMDAIDRSEAILKAERDIFVTARELGQDRYSQRFLQAVDHAIKFSEKDRPQSIRVWMAEFGVPGEAPVTGSGPGNAADTNSDAAEDEATSIDLTTGELFASTVKMEPTAVAPPGADIETVIDPGFQAGTRSGKRPFWVLGGLFMALLVITGGLVYSGPGRELLSQWPGGGGTPDLADPPSVPDPATAAVGLSKPTGVQEKSSPVGVTAAVSGMAAESSPGSSGPEADKGITGLTDRGVASTDSGQGSVEGDQNGRQVQAGMTPGRPPPSVPIAAVPLVTESGPTKPSAADIAASEPTGPEPAAPVGVAAVTTPSALDLLLERAGAALASGQLIMPEGDNALALYRQARQLEEDDPRTRTGLERLGIRLAARAEQALTRGDFEAAGADIDAAVGLRPGDDNLRRLQSELQRAQRREADRQRIGELLGLAREAMGRDDLVRPVQASALGYYRQVQALDPGNTEAESGLTVITDALAEEAARAVAGNDFEQAREALNQALAIRPQSARLQAERQRLRQAEAERRMAREQDARLRGLLADAEADLAALRLTSPRGRNALEKYRQAEQLDPGNSGAEAGLRRIVGRYVALAGKAESAGRLDQATAYLDKAAKVLPGAANIALARESLALKRSRHELREQQAQRQRQIEAGVRRQAREQDRRQQEQRRQAERERQISAALEAQFRAEQEQRRQAEEKARLEAPTMSLRITGLGERYKPQGVSAAKLAPEIISKLTAAGWEVLGEKRIGQRPNALLMHVKFHANYNDSTGIYSYAVSVNIRERARLPEADDRFATVPIWSKGQNGIAQAYDFRKLNGIIMKFVAQFLASHSRL